MSALEELLTVSVRPAPLPGGLTIAGSGGFGLAGAGGPMPGQELVDPVDRVIGDAGEDVTQVGFGVDAVQFAGFDQAVGHLEAPLVLVRFG
jgi:hypothetical protein